MRATQPPFLHPRLWRLRLPRIGLPPLRRWAHIRRQRRHLAALSDRMLEDIGLTREEALNEAARPFWDAPRP